LEADYAAEATSLEVRLINDSLREASAKIEKQINSESWRGVEL